MAVVAYALYCREGSARMRGRRFFFFQAEDGIRDYKVTGVQTCALPIYSRKRGQRTPVAASSTPRARGSNPVATRGNGTGIEGGRAGLGPHRARNLCLITAWRICKKAHTAAAFDGRSEERRVGKGVDLGGRR